MQPVIPQGPDLKKQFICDSSKIFEQWDVESEYKSVFAAGITVHHGDRRERERWVRTDCNVELAA